MRLLLDTHVAIWALTAPERLTAGGRDLISDPGNTIFVSAASMWEIAIKRALGRVRAPALSASEATASFGLAGFLLLDITAAHAAATESLPPLHADPFDRLLIAQAFTEPLRLLTHDAKMMDYSASFLRV